MPISERSCLRVPLAWHLSSLCCLPLQVHAYLSLSAVSQTDVDEEQVIQVAYSLLWAIVVFGPLQQRLYESAFLVDGFGKANDLHPRFPRSLPAVIVGLLETTYLWGFLFLEIVVTFCPMLAKVVTQNPEQLEFLPLMLTSLYCAVGLIWAYARLSFLYITSK